MKGKEEVLSLLKSSSQYTRWLYDQDTLNAKFHKRRLDVYQENLRKFSDPSNSLHIGLNEENKVLNSYISDFISETCKVRKLKLTVEGTAITYFKRWFLKKTLLNHEPRQIALTSLYLACKVEEVSYEVIKTIAECVKRDLKFHLIHFNSEHYGKVEKEMIEYLNFDLKVYTVFGPLNCILNSLKENMVNDQQNFKQIEEESLKLARKSFFDHLIFKHTHGAIALSIILSVLKKRGISLGEFYKIIKNNPYFPLEDIQENENALEEIENELKNFDKIDIKNLHNEAKVVLQQAKEIFRKVRMVESAVPVGVFQRPIEKVNVLKRQNSHTSQNFIRIEEKKTEGKEKEENENKESNNLKRDRDVVKEGKENEENENLEGNPEKKLKLN